MALDDEPCPLLSDGALSYDNLTPENVASTSEEEEIEEEAEAEATPRHQHNSATALTRPEACSYLATGQVCDASEGPLHSPTSAAHPPHCSGPSRLC